MPELVEGQVTKATVIPGLTRNPVMKVEILRYAQNDSMTEILRYAQNDSMTEILPYAQNDSRIEILRYAQNDILGFLNLFIEITVALARRSDRMTVEGL